MVQNQNPKVAQLQFACKQSNAHWAVWLHYANQKWSTGLHFGLSQARLATLQKFLADPLRSNWLGGALASGRTRWQECGENGRKLNCSRIYLFPNLEVHQLLAVGSDGLDTGGENMMRLLAISPSLSDIDSRQKELVELVRQLEAIRSTALDITADLDLEAVLKRIVLRARDLVGARGAELGLVDTETPTDGQPGVRVMISEVPWTDMRGYKIPLLAGLAGTMVVTNQSVAVDDYNAWENRLMPERIAPFKAAAGVPLQSSGQMIGTLTVMDDKPDRVFTASDLNILEMMAPQAAIAIRNAQLFKEIEQQVQNQQATESRLVRAARMAAVGEMAGSVAHELNNPLTSVIMSIELVMKQLLPESAQYNDLSQALEESLRCRGVIQRLLNVSRDTRPISEPYDQIGFNR
jgi:hypothetical protein